MLEREIRRRVRLEFSDLISNWKIQMQRKLIKKADGKLGTSLEHVACEFSSAIFGKSNICKINRFGPVIVSNSDIRLTSACFGPARDFSRGLKCSGNSFCGSHLREDHT